MAEDAGKPSAAPASTKNAEKPDEPRDVPVSRGQGFRGDDNSPVARTLARVRWRPSRRTIGLGFALFGMCALIVVDVVFMARSASQRNAEPQTSLQLSAIAAPSQSIAQSQPSVAVANDGLDASAPIFDEQSVEGEPSSTKPEVPRHYATVQEAASRSCSTASVEGLSRQIINEARCINPNAFAPLPTRPNLVLDTHVFPYLEVQARDHLVRVLDAHRDGIMTVHSALRTVAQQYLVWRWSANKRCGVPLATPPGDSNHENGLAIDIAEQSRWRPALEAQGFHWLGASDKVHFDYKGAVASPHRSEDVRAFQRLWNRNHPNDSIANDGHYSSTTEQRLKKAPADGFRIGAICARPKSAKAGT